MSSWRTRQGRLAQRRIAAGQQAASAAATAALSLPAGTSDWDLEPINAENGQLCASYATPTDRGVEQERQVAGQTVAVPS